MSMNVAGTCWHGTPPFEIPAKGEAVVGVGENEIARGPITLMTSHL